MRRNLRLAALFALFCAVSIWFAVAQTPPITLHVGDPAPKLQVGKWIQGEPVKEFESDKVYVVEFWATWCVTCKATIPHLNELHKKYKDKGVVIIGQDIAEEDVEDVPKFVKQMGDKMTYRVATDDLSQGPKGFMDKNWMDAAGRSGLPSAFIVKQGKLAWIGSGTEVNEKLIDEILRPDYDIKKAAAEYAEKVERKQKYDAVFDDFQKAVGAKEWAKSQQLLTELEKYTEPRDMPDLQVVRLRLNLKQPDLAAAEVTAKKAAEYEPENASYHSGLAWMLATQAPESKSLLALAEKEALRANDIAKGKDGDVLDTLARVRFVKGDKQAAIATEEKAIEAGDEKEKTAYRKTLEAYKAGKLPES